MHAKQMLHELRSTLSDARATGDLPGHLRAWLKTITVSDDNPRANNHPEFVEGPNTQSPISNTVFPGATITVHGIPARVLYPVANVPGYWAVAVSGQLNRSVHERDIQVVA